MAKIYLDPGHGFDTPGKRSPDSSLLEYEFNQVVADLAENLLLAQGFDVRVTKRMKDKDLDLTTRCNLANNWGADIFLSIHANAATSTWSTAKGWEVYSYPGNVSGAKLAKLAEQYSYPEIANFGVNNRGCRTENFAVIRQTKMPAILFEFAFFSNKKECELLKRDDFRKACAVGVAKTACAWFGITYKATSKPEQTPKPIKPVFKINVDGVEEHYDTKDASYKRGWELLKNGYKDVFVIESDGGKYTFGKHPEDNPNAFKLNVNGVIEVYFNSKEASDRGWYLFNNGYPDVILTDPEGIYTFAKHPEDNPQKPTLAEPIKVSGTRIEGNAEVVDGNVIDAFIRQSNPNAPAVGKAYLEIGTQLGIRGDIAVCQAIKETGWFKYGGDVTPDQNNFCGLGTTGGGVKGASFPTVKDGAMAHMQHLWAYITNQPLPSGIIVIDPRFSLVQSLNKNASYFEDLGGRWAVPGFDKKKYTSFDEAFKADSTYGQEIVQIFATLKEFAAKQKSNPIKTVVDKRIEKKNVFYTFTIVNNSKILSTIVDGKGYVRVSDIAAMFDRKALWDNEKSEIVISNLPPSNKKFEAPGNKKIVYEDVTFTFVHVDDSDLEAILINGKGYVRVSDIAKIFGYTAKFDSITQEITFVK